MANEKNYEFLRQFDRGEANPSQLQPIVKQPLGFKTPDGVFHPTTPAPTPKPAKKKK